MAHGHGMSYLLDKNTAQLLYGTCIMHYL